MTPKLHTHDTSISIAKAIAIMAVVISHAAVGTPLETFTYYFNTAVFFFVAGYLFRDKQIDRPLEFVKKKLFRLYLPYLLFGALFVLLHNKFIEWHLIAYDFNNRVALHPYETQELLRTLGKVLLFCHHEQLLSPLWFLQGLFLGLMGFFCVTWISRKLTSAPFSAERLRAGIILVVFSAAMILVNRPIGIPGEWIIVRAMIITGVMYLGKLYSIYRGRIPLNSYIALVCLGLLITAAYFHYSVNIGAPRVGNPLVFLLIVCCGCYMVLTAAKRIAVPNNRFTRIMDYIGRHTMAVMIWHICAFKLVTLLQIWIYDYPIRHLAFYPVIFKNNEWWWIAYTLVGTTVPVGCCLLYDRLRLRRSARS